MYQRYFLIEPEVVGTWGENTLAEIDVYPPNVVHLECQFDVLPEDCIAESFPCFIIRNDVARHIIEAGMSGIELQDITMSRSRIFEELYDNREIPLFVRLVVNGIPKQDDFWLTEGSQLVASDAALTLLKSRGLQGAKIRALTS